MLMVMLFDINESIWFQKLKGKKRKKPTPKTRKKKRN